MLASLRLVWRFVVCFAAGADTITSMDIRNLADSANRAATRTL